MPETLTANYRIVTPMFIGDADRDATEITAASVKGALRFWWRALNWGRFRNQVDANNESALRALHAAEADLFGAAADDKMPGRGQSKFLLQVNPVKKWEYMNSDWPLSKTGSGYLGQGLWESGSPENNNYQAPRTALSEGQDFVIKIVFKPMPEARLEKMVSDMKELMTLWGLVGGLGSRARRGFGSVQLLQLGDNSIVMEKESDWYAALSSLRSCHQMSETYPPYSAFSRHSKLGYFGVAKDARKSHEKLGNHFKGFRGEPSELRGDIKRIFGMPLPGGGAKMGKARRGSPLFFHIAQLGEERFVSTIMSLPTEPFHSDATLNGVDWLIIDRFFSGLSSWNGETT